MPQILRQVPMARAHPDNAADARGVNAPDSNGVEEISCGSIPASSSWRSWQPSLWSWPHARRGMGITQRGPRPVPGPSATRQRPRPPSRMRPIPGSSDLQIGLVTDVGTLDDRNFNQYSWEGALRGAATIGAPEPQNVITTESSEYDDQHRLVRRARAIDVVVTVGFALGEATLAAADATTRTFTSSVSTSSRPVTTSSREPGFRTTRASSSPRRRPATWPASRPPASASRVSSP